MSVNDNVIKSLTPRSSRLTNMVDSAGTTRYAYDAAGQLLTASGPFSSDTLTNTYSNRRRVALALQEPSGHVFTNGFGWDLAGRLTSATSPAGGFAYAYMALDSTFSGRLVQELAFPSGAYITNFYDPVARLVGTVLESSGSSALDAALYGYNEGNQRTAYTNAAGAYDLYTYDPIGQLKVGTSSAVSEDRGYGYDAAWNLSYLTNNGVATEFDVDNRNELVDVLAQGSFTYDANGNLLTGTGTRVGAGTNWNYIYDDENRLVQWFYYQNGIANPATGDLRTDFRYDGLGRLRQRLEYLYNAPTNLLLLVAGWTSQLTNEYLYDGWRVIQERDGSNVPLVSYTRGNDLSGSLEGAGGIGGLLARSSGYSSGNWTSHAYYHADGNGNITCLINASQSVVASYRYDPFGNTLSQSGTLADANVYRFSSKEIHTNSLMYHYGYRFYDPGLQRWINRDPLLENGGINLYSGIGNRPVNAIDPWGWSDVNAPPGSVTGPSPGFPNPNPILPGPGQVPPGYNPSWPTGVDSRGPYVMNPITGTKYYPHPEDSGHWPHYDSKDPSGKEGRFPTKCKKPWPGQKRPPYGDQSPNNPWPQPPPPPALPPDTVVPVLINPIIPIASPSPVMISDPIIIFDPVPVIP